MRRTLFYSSVALLAFGIASLVLYLILYMDKETIKTFAPLFPAIVTTLGIVVSYYIFFRSVRANSNPVLIFTSRGEGTRWKLQNYGNGPALNILVAEGATSKHWDEIVNCYPLSVDSSVELVWLKRAGILAATYSNIYGEQFTSICHHNQTQIIMGNKFPKWKSNNHEWTEVLLAKNRKYINEKELDGHTNFYLDKMRNEPYARRGYIFKRTDLADYFSKKPWYKPVTGDVQEIESQLTEKEKSISYFILYYQIKRKYEGKEN